MTEAQIFGLVLDGILLFLVGISLVIGAKKGFAGIVAELVAWLGAVAGAFVGSRLLSSWIYDTFLASLAEEQVTGAITQAEGQLQPTLQNFLEGLPPLMSNILSSGIKEPFLQDFLDLSNQELTPLLMESWVRPALTSLLNGLLFLLLFLLLFALLSLVAKKLKGKWEIPVLGKLNSFLGGVIGLAQGLLVSGAFFLAVLVVASLFGDRLPFFTHETLASSHLAGWLLPYFSSFPHLAG